MMMVTASELRRRAREKLFRPGVGTGYGTYLLGLLLQCLVGGIGMIAMTGLFFGICGGMFYALRETSVTDIPVWTYAVLMPAATALVLGILYVVGFMSWGQRAMSVALMRDGLTTSHWFCGKGNGWRMVSLIMWQQTFVFFWALLFIVPGVRALFSYAMAPFLLIDHPDWPPRRCLAESKRMMEGHRWRYFCLNLSFIGWQLLSAIAVQILNGLAVLLLTPYVDSACAAFYEDLLDRQDHEKAHAGATLISDKKKEDDLS